MNLYSLLRQIGNKPMNMASPVELGSLLALRTHTVSILTSASPAPSETRKTFSDVEREA